MSFKYMTNIHCVFIEMHVLCEHRTMNSKVANCGGVWVEIIKVCLWGAVNCRQE